VGKTYATGITVSKERKRVDKCAKFKRMTKFSRHAFGWESQNLMNTPSVQVLDMRTSWRCGELGSI
jgi:hypothetical protein